MTHPPHPHPPRPGDILWSASGDGWQAEVLLTEYVPHIRATVRHTLRLSTEPDGFLRRDLRFPDEKVMGVSLDKSWGWAGPNYSHRYLYVEHSGSTIEQLELDSILYLRTEISLLEALRARSGP